MSGFPLDSSAIFKHYERKSLIMADRSAESVTAWLRDHPGVDLITRDRAGTYADACGLPESLAAIYRKFGHMGKLACRAIQVTKMLEFSGYQPCLYQAA